MSENKTVPDAIRDLDRLEKILNNPQNPLSPNGLTAADRILGIYSAKELEMLPGNSKREQQSRANSNTEDLVGNSIDFLKRTTAQSNNMINELTELNIVAPELKMASRVYVSSVLSPNDMCSHRVSYTSYSSLLTGESNSAIGKLCTDFFNGADYNLGVRLKKDIEACLITEGAAPYLIMPQRNLRLLADELTVNDQIAFEGLDDTQMFEQFHQQGSSRLTIAYEGYDKDFGNDVSIQSSLEEIFDTTINEYVIAMESFDGATEDRIDPNQLKQIKADKKGIISTTVDKIANAIKDTVDVTKDVGIIYDRQQVQKQQIIKKSKDIETILCDKNHRSSMLMKLTERRILDKDDVPARIRLPTGSVNPIYSPGAPDEHIAYLVLTEAGTPIGPQTATLSSGEYLGNNKNTSLVINSIFGVNVPEQLAQIPRQAQVNLISNLFGVIVDNLLKSKVTEKGYTGVDLHRTNAFASAIFNNVIQKKNVKLVYVPEPLMVYYCFEYRNNGTGKTLTEDLRTLIAIRTTLLYANLGIMIENSTTHRNVTVSAPKNGINILKLMEKVRNTLMEKEKMIYSTNPGQIQEQLLTRGLHITPETLEGANLKVNVENTSRTSERIDTDLLESVSNLINIGTYLPPSVTNQLNETEFSRSVASQHLLFANIIIDLQSILIKHIDKESRTFIIFCHSLAKKIKDIIVNDTQIQTTKLNGKKFEDLSEEEKEEFNLQLDDLLVSVLMDLKSSLPEPRTLANSAVFDEYAKFQTGLTQILNDIYSDELVGQDLKDQISQLRAQIKTACTLQYAESIGLRAAFNLPNFAEVDSMFQTRLSLLLKNISAGAESVIAALTPKEGGNEY